MAHRGSGFVPLPPTPPVGTDYSWNWVGQNYGVGYFPEPTEIVGGPGGYYFDFGTTTEPPPTGSTSKIWDGAAWQSADDAKVWDGSSWVPLAGARVWADTEWVTF